MKVIELLTKIANGEEVPKKIRFDDMIWNKICGEKNIYYINEYDSDLFVYFFRKNITFDLNDEIEIIEEDKKIEKLNTKDVFACDDNIRVYFAFTWSKINEIIDYINGGTNGE